ncbi:pimeloyl-ACP methyl ester esterase BioH [Thalassotalea ganghwensis]
MANLLNITSSGQGKTLVLLHGWGLNSAIWQPVAKLLSKEMKVITVSLPGYGDNANFQLDSYSIDNVAKAIVDVVEEPAIYLGWSLGGLVASHIALSFPAQVQGLITVASTPFFVQESHWPGIDPKVLTLFHRQLSQDTAKVIDNFLKIQAMGSPHVREDIKSIRDLVMQYPMPSSATLDQSLSLLETVDLRSNLPQIHQSFLRLYGRLDGLVPKSVIDKINLLTPNSECYVFEKASHAPFISCQEEFIHVISQWVNKQSVPKGKNN